MPQPAYRTVVQHSLGFSPSQYLGEIEVYYRDGSRDSTQHGIGSGEIGRHRLFNEYGLAAVECHQRYFGLKLRRRSDGNRVDGNILDQFAPISEGPVNAETRGEHCRTGRIRSRQRHGATSFIETEGRQLDREAIIAADNANRIIGASFAAERTALSELSGDGFVIAATPTIRATPPKAKRRGAIAG